VLAGMLIPFQVALIPLYQTMRDVGLLGSLWALVILYAGMQVPFSIFLYTGFLRTIPREYEEAASIDGAGALRASCRCWSSTSCCNARSSAVSRAG
jgi:raffinose/stachyose/melibiose transport system permease protein